ncbi:hypothetical protein Sme01_16680 [Sphaerisporangium melleum]|uniref:Uncharacterized protein n=2 Tax=Sphaerisporangium melleum TaxID=321316 RepID=A0A917R1S7_9ACTN|nr:hypothetical protein GCM10007964_26620 [Sphaerisporangium melleum]GII69192.1 hypothetical protein Sme01_16680 [Sphaerisporangium melleum]
MAGFMKPSDTARATGPICDDMKIKSLGNDRLLAPELDYTGYVKGMVRARTISAGEWEWFTVCKHDGGFETILAWAANRYLAAELDYTGADTGMLRARSTSIREWEKFDIQCPSYCTIRSLANNKYVAAELAYTGSGYGMLRARSTSVGAWEKFQ